MARIGLLSRSCGFDPRLAYQSRINPGTGSLAQYRHRVADPVSVGQAVGMRDLLFRALAGVRGVCRTQQVLAALVASSYGSHLVTVIDVIWVSATGPAMRK